METAILVLFKKKKKEQNGNVFLRRENGNLKLSSL